MNRPGDIVLLSDSLNSPGNRALQRALAELGEIRLAREDSLLQDLEAHPCKLLILDAGVLERRSDVLIRAVKSSYPDLQIVLLTASPHWKVAKAALMAGAEYIEKSLDPKILTERFAPVVKALGDAGTADSASSEQGDPGG